MASDIRAAPVPPEADPFKPDPFIEAALGTVDPQNEVCRTAARGIHPIERQFVSNSNLKWEVDWKGYAPPDADVTEILEQGKGEGWAEADIEEAAVAELSRNPMKRNPIGRTGYKKRGTLGHWGPNRAVDIVILRHTSVGSEKRTEVMLTQRNDGECAWAFPGVFIMKEDLDPDEGEAERVRTLRPCVERLLKAKVVLIDPEKNDATAHEARLLDLLTQHARVIMRGGKSIGLDDRCPGLDGNPLGEKDPTPWFYIDDHRNTDHAWVETAFVVCDLREVDKEQAEWPSDETSDSRSTLGRMSDLPKEKKYKKYSLNCEWVWREKLKDEAALYALFGSHKTAIWRVLNSASSQLGLTTQLRSFKLDLVVEAHKIDPQSCHLVTRNDQSYLVITMELHTQVANELRKKNKYEEGTLSSYVPERSNDNGASSASVTRSPSMLQMATKQEWKAERLEVHLLLSKWCGVNVPWTERPRLGIPLAARSFAYVYGLRDSSVGGSSPLAITWKPPPLLEFGGFVYYGSDGSKRGASSLLGVTQLNPPHLSAPYNRFFRPIHFANARQIWMDWEKPNPEDFVQMTMPDLRDQLNCKSFRWYSPREALRPNQSDQPGGRPRDEHHKLKHGGFVLYHESSEAYVCFEIVARPSSRSFLDEEELRLAVERSKFGQRYDLFRDAIELGEEAVVQMVLQGKLALPEYLPSLPDYHVRIQGTKLDQHLGRDASGRSFTALAIAVRFGRHSMVESLLKSGAKIEKAYSATRATQLTQSTAAASQRESARAIRGREAEEVLMREALDLHELVDAQQKTLRLKAAIRLLPGYFQLHEVRVLENAVEIAIEAARQAALQYSRADAELFTKLSEEAQRAATELLSKLPHEKLDAVIETRRAQRVLKKAVASSCVPLFNSNELQAALRRTYRGKWFDALLTRTVLTPEGSTVPLTSEEYRGRLVATVALIAVNLLMLFYLLFNPSYEATLRSELQKVNSNRQTQQRPRFIRFVQWVFRKCISEDMHRARDSPNSSTRDGLGDRHLYCGAPQDDNAQDAHFDRSLYIYWPSVYLLGCKTFNNWLISVSAVLLVIMLTTMPRPMYLLQGEPLSVSVVLLALVWLLCTLWYELYSLWLSYNNRQKDASGVEAGKAQTYSKPISTLSSCFGDVLDVLDVISVLFALVAMIVAIFVSEEWFEPLMAPGILLMCLAHGMRVARLFKVLGPFVLMLYDMVIDFIKWMCIFGIVLLAFLCAFHRTYQHLPPPHSGGSHDDEQSCEDWLSNFGHSPYAILHLLVVPLDSGSARMECFEKSEFRYTGQLLMLVYMMSSIVLLLNIAIALMNDTYTRLRTEKESLFLFLFALQAVSDKLDSIALNDVEQHEDTPDDVLIPRMGAVLIPPLTVFKLAHWVLRHTHTTDGERAGAELQENTVTDAKVGGSSDEAQDSPTSGRHCIEVSSPPLLRNGHGSPYENIAVNPDRYAKQVFSPLNGVSQLARSVANIASRCWRQVWLHLENAESHVMRLV